MSWESDVQVGLSIPLRSIAKPSYSRHCLCTQRCSSLAKTSVSADNDDQADSDFFPNTARADKLVKTKFQHLDNFSPPDKLDARSANFFLLFGEGYLENRRKSKKFNVHADNFFTLDKISLRG